MISVVSGCRNERDNVAELVQRIEAALAQAKEKDWEIILIDNDSKDGTQEVLRSLAKANSKIKVILNSRNFGHIRSPYHAILQGRGDAVIYLASDLQEPPEMIPELLLKWKEGAEVVAAVKSESAESPLFFLVRRFYYWLLQELADVRTIPNFTGFGLYSRRVLDYCRQLHDPYPYFRGLISEIGLPISIVKYRQPKRVRGFSKNNFYTLYDMALLGITNHSKVPLRLATLSGFVLSLLSFFVGCGYLVYKLMFWERFSLGIAPALIGLFFFCSVILFFIGILGEYIGAIHTQVLKRPLVVEKERINF
jgi:glycosyltransferase involved in cell wall biosynthesis